MLHGLPNSLSANSKQPQSRCDGLCLRSGHFVAGYLSMKVDNPLALSPFPYF